MRQFERTADFGAEKAATAANSGVASVVGAIGRAFGFFRRFGRHEKPDDEAAARPARAHARRARDDNGLQAGIDRLEMEIVRLEGELDQVYTSVVRGADSVKRDEYDGGYQELSPLLERARELKEGLRERRAELLRRKREAARQSRLSESVPVEGTGARQPTAPRTAKGPPVARDDPVGNPGLRRAIARAAPNISFSDSSQRVIFEKVLHDLADEDADIRRAAAARVSEFGGPEMSDILLAALEDHDGKVRIAALNSLALVGDRSAKQVFIRYTSDTDYLLRLAALRGLARVGDEATSQYLFVGLEDAHASVRKAAATYLGWRRDKSATKMLVSMLHDEDEDLRCAVATALGSIRDDRAVLSLIRALADRNPAVRRKAKKALANTLGEEIDADVEAGEEALQSRIAELREWWKKARVDKHFQRRGGLPLADVGEEPYAPAPRLDEGPAAVRQDEGPAAVRQDVGPAAVRQDEGTPLDEAPPASVTAAPATADVPKADVAAADLSKGDPPAGSAAKPAAADAANAIDGLSSLGLEGLDLSIGGAAIGTAEEDDKFESLLGSDLGLSNIVTADGEKK